MILINLLWHHLEPAWYFMTNLTTSHHGTIMAHRVGILVHNLNTTDLCSVTCRNWYSNNHRYPPIYPEGIFFPKNNHRRLFTAENWIHNCKNYGLPEDTSFLVLWWCNKKWDQSDFPHLAKKHISAMLTKFTLPPMLPQTQSENIQLQNIPSIPVPDPRVEPVFQPPRVKMHQSAPTRPTRDNI